MVRSGDQSDSSHGASASHLSRSALRSRVVCQPLASSGWPVGPVITGATVRSVCHSWCGSTRTVKVSPFSSTATGADEVITVSRW